MRSHDASCLCHGHAAPLPYPVPYGAPAYTVYGGEDVEFFDFNTHDETVRWRTRAHAEEYARRKQKLSRELQAQFNAEARR